MTKVARVGFVEDSDEDFAVFARVFSREWELDRWVTAERALEAFSDSESVLASFAVLFVDNDLPGIDGVELIRQVRRLDGGELPVVCMVSGSGRSALSGQAIAAGADAFIAKPDDLAGVRAMAVQVAALAA